MNFQISFFKIRIIFLIYINVVICPKSLLKKCTWLENSYWNILIIHCSDISNYLPCSTDLNDCLLYKIRMKSRYVILRGDIVENQQVQTLCLLFSNCIFFNIIVIPDPFTIKTEPLTKLYNSIYYNLPENYSNENNRSHHLKNIKVNLSPYQEKLFQSGILKIIF